MKKSEIIQAAPVQPWEKQPGEPSAAFAAFKVYRDMGYKRTLLKTTQEYCQKNAKMPYGHIADYADKYNWKERAGAWDGEQDRQDIEQRFERVKEMNKRHSEIGKIIIEKLLSAVRMIDPRKVRLDYLPRLLDVAARIERLSLGQASENIAFKGSLGVESMNIQADEERQRLEEEFKGIFNDIREIRNSSKAK